MNPPPFLVSPCVRVWLIGRSLSPWLLQVQRLVPAVWNTSTWSPGMRYPAADPGQLFGTFHTLDANLVGVRLGSRHAIAPCELTVASVRGRTARLLD